MICIVVVSGIDNCVNFVFNVIGFYYIVFCIVDYSGKVYIDIIFLDGFYVRIIRCDFLVFKVKCGGEIL